MTGHHTVGVINSTLEAKRENTPNEFKQQANNSNGVLLLLLSIHSIPFRHDYSYLGNT